MIKILVVGELHGHHRSQIFIQKLMHKNMGSSDNYSLGYANPGFYNSSFQSPGMVFKVLRKIFNIITSPLFIAELVFKIPFCDKIYFLALNHRKFIILYLVNLIWRKPIICDLYISVYDAFKDRGKLDAGIFNKLIRGNFAWYLKMLDRVMIERSTKVIYVGMTELKYVAKEVGADLTKSSVVIIPPASNRKTTATPTDSPTLRICWWGTYTPFHGVDNILKAAGLLNDKGVNFSLDLFGTPMYDSSKYEALAAELGIENNVNFHTDKTFGNGKLEGYLTKYCDIALGNFSFSERAKRAVPTKIIDAFSMKIPVISMETEVLREYADVENDLFVCNENPESLAALIVEISQEKVELARRADNGYKLFETRFTPEAVQAHFIKVIQDL